MRYFIKLAYNGSTFHGWQRQENAHSVQEELEKCISLLLSETIEITGCGRTDTGVHAKDFYAHFDSDKTFDESLLAILTNKLNRFLPKSIVIYSIYPVVDNPHARFSAVSRTYKYYIHKRKDPFLEDFSFFYYPELDIKKMNEACKVLFEYIDFSCFSKSHTQTKTNNCKILQAYWENIDHQYIFTIQADRFLRNMVRAIVGTLLEIGIGKIDINDFRKIIETQNRSEAGISVPAKGLFLEKVEY